MNQDRTSTITNSQLKEGYKQTEVGIIPEDWEVMLVGDAFEICNHLRLPISREVRQKISGKYPYYGPTQIQDYINEYRVEGTYALIGEDGDHFFKCSEQSMTLLASGQFNVNNHAHLIRGISNITEWFYYYFQHRDISINLTRQGASRFKLTKAALLKIPCALPPTKTEQEAIACTLSDIDALIESLDRLLTKKRQIKQGAMQELLRSKDGWEKKRIGEVLTISHGRSQHEVVDENGDYPILASGGQIGRATTYLYNKPSVLIGRKGTIDKPQYMERPFWTVDTLFYSVIHEPNNAKYLFYQFCLIPWREYNEASGVPSLNAKTIESIEIKLPSPKEQIEIANILSDMDAEIGSIESKLTKTRQLKQGMMHELLTGRIRLVDNTSIS